MYVYIQMLDGIVRKEKYDRSQQFRKRVQHKQNRKRVQHKQNPRHCCSYIGWQQLVGSLKSQVSFAEYRLFYRALLQKRPLILRSLLIVATPQHLTARPALNAAHEMHPIYQHISPLSFSKIFPKAPNLAFGDHVRISEAHVASLRNLSFGRHGNGLSTAPSFQVTKCHNVFGTCRQITKLTLQIQTSRDFHVRWTCPFSF